MQQPAFRSGEHLDPAITVQIRRADLHHPLGTDLAPARREDVIPSHGPLAVQHGQPTLPGPHDRLGDPIAVDIGQMHIADLAPTIV